MVAESAPKTVLITGVPGWLSHALVEGFSSGKWGQQYDKVRCLVAPFNASALKKPVSDKVEHIAGDLLDPASLAKAVEGVHSIIHTAGIIHVSRVADWYRVNFDGTKNLLAEAQTAGVKSFVYVSSNAAAGRSEDGRPMLESQPPRPLSHYGESKLRAEQAVIAASDKMHTSVLRPCMFYGPPVPDRHVEFFRLVKFGRVPMVGSGTYARSMVHVENLAQSCWLALQTPAARGETFYIADEDAYTVNQFIDSIATAMNVQPRYLRLPPIVSTICYQLDRLLNALGIYQQTLHLVGEATWSVGVSVDKAKRILGYRPTRTLQEGITEAVRWSDQTGLLQQRGAKSFASAPAPR